MVTICKDGTCSDLARCLIIGKLYALLMTHINEVCNLNHTSVNTQFTPKFVHSSIHMMKAGNSSSIPCQSIARQERATCLPGLRQNMWEQRQSSTIAEQERETHHARLEVGALVAEKGEMEERDILKRKMKQKVSRQWEVPVQDRL